MARIRNERLTLRIEGNEKKRFQEKAREDGRSLSGWILHTLKLAAPSSTRSGHGKPA